MIRTILAGFAALGIFVAGCGGGDAKPKTPDKPKAAEPAKDKDKDKGK